MLDPEADGSKRKPFCGMLKGENLPKQSESVRPEAKNK
jgi:hypothetical protein